MAILPQNEKHEKKHETNLINMYNKIKNTCYPPIKWNTILLAVMQNTFKKKMKAKFYKKIYIYIYSTLLKDTYSLKWNCLFYFLGEL